MSFIETIKAKAKANLQTIVLPESLELRTLEATQQILAGGIAKVILIGNEEEIKGVAGNLDISGATIVDPLKFEAMEEYVATLVELRAKKGMTEERAHELLTTNALFLGVMMVKKGMANGIVAGAVNSTANVLRPSLQILKTAPGTKLVSSFFVMVVPDCDLGANGTFIFSDCGLVQNPTADELASIAGSSAKSFEALVGEEAVVGMLSHSTKGSAAHPDVDKVVEATRLAKEQFPDAGNIGYKLSQRLAKAESYGPITQGIAMPVNDLSRGCTADDIVGVVAVTCVQAINQG